MLRSSLIARPLVASRLPARPALLHSAAAKFGVNTDGREYNEVEVQKNKHVEHKPLAIEYIYTHVDWSLFSLFRLL
jgi:hypothetical protein